MKNVSLHYNIPIGHINKLKGQTSSAEVIKFLDYLNNFLRCSAPIRLSVMSYNLHPSLINRLPNTQ